ncbi:radical sam domain-containing protein : Putative menaquinone biosynthesis protein, SCO4494 family OS=Singulisphaera acidiphila (strain ATCC BAA-1392 / DSM 18658 / VKM B-2454 / MOB10) GN=Sinac_1135 PE=4 SV=1: Radical_SAM [Gemmataceae bacterium]|nr:radical sam domain-containing protein : Putative menaquinone biosynthesis protein, SCO4494 family OS=Singulisphaera acidiphila (strain ATCC BAA-1392 / DSM 18658 / VKM B-2454 / MOB10) GN=Sinac_1135 PE=4 SV=1: Radical_SAM [Gemmataceae bacterium]VTU02841.1 radical sam domain-containing protein : Putative menaquinone biosynthesis protein, SCO4494 family OS=Singulisphaera acidiphila (strain ATCC BAA-1392 / DSM 18658 / VKM B-2454 / MOB10) GN=Sinac_1135 PE=4 SV=1: Radical_SAM [Gemmataceae bacterium]
MTAPTDPKLAAIRDKVHAGERLTFDDGLALEATSDLFTLGELANLVRERKNGSVTFYNVNTHLNPTNVCVYRCAFCSFRSDLKGPTGYVMTDEQILGRAREATERGCTELHVVGGLHHQLPYEWYLNIIASIHREFPDLHLKAWTAVEWDWFEKLTKRSTRDLLAEMRDAGLGSLPGGGAEIFHPEVRSKICDYKADADQWLGVHRTWHELGGKSNATMLYGHIERPEHRIDHLLRLRGLQDETGGFQTFIPLAFHPSNNPLGKGIPKPSGMMDLKVMAVSRLMLDNFPHIKAYWQMLTAKVAQVAQSWGADDIDGTVVHEKIYHAAGSDSPQEMTVADLRRLIEEAGRVPVERDTLYREVVRDQPVGKRWQTGRRLVTLN